MILLCFSSQAIVGQTYQSEVLKAGKAYENKKYDSCTYYFKNAFKIQSPTGRDLYNAAICNALNDNQRQAFDFLFQAIKNGINISKLRIDPELESLHKHSKWKKLLRKANKIQSDSFNKYQYPEYAAQLARLWEEDQYYRFRLGNAYKNNDTTLANALWKKMRTADSLVLMKFQSILDSIGWPSKSKVGSLGANAAFLIIDHAPREIMEKYFPHLESSAKKGDIPLSNFATLKDRVLVNRGKKQIYGTQKYWDAQQGKFVFFPIEDEKNVNSLRKTVGLEALKDFE